MVYAVVFFVAGNAHFSTMDASSTASAPVVSGFDAAHPSIARECNVMFVHPGPPQAQAQIQLLPEEL